MNRNLAKTVFSRVIGGGTLLLLASGNPAQGAILITGQEIGNDVVFSYEGSINLTDLNMFGSSNVTGGINPFLGAFSFVGGLSDVDTDNYFPTITGPAAFGSGNLTSPLASLNSGNVFVFFPSINLIAFAQGYSGDNISGSMTFNDTDFATLGVDNSQDYTWTLGNNETIRLSFLAPPTAVPEPSVILGSMMVLGVGRMMNKRNQNSSRNLQ
ncbi:hypothetical protein Cyast_0986 [Cyanobacterium stanieri PCC 7202]|uniref:PEP motif anchor domain protein n=1 Tax=Cyanobacterium stanieri (strain ATCC 29140 / PCC 7202) TaxID=292563 RepID=K9YLG4_CYASC|nr:hypothetical protein Cyast_0986 [Cyanobacterium stanieri PCC 7202]